MIYTIINRQGQFLDNESFRSLDSDSPKELIWHTLNKEYFAQFSEKDKHTIIEISPREYQREKPILGYINNTRLIALEEKLETGNFQVIPHPGYFYEFETGSDGMVYSYAIPRGEKEKSRGEFIVSYFLPIEKEEVLTPINDDSEPLETPVC